MGRHVPISAVSPSSSIPAEPRVINQLTCLNVDNFSPHVYLLREGYLSCLDRTFLGVCVVISCGEGAQEKQQQKIATAAGATHPNKMSQKAGRKGDPPLPPSPAYSNFIFVNCVPPVRPWGTWHIPVSHIHRSGTAGHPSTLRFSYS